MKKVGLTDNAYALAQCRIFDDAGNPTTVGELWKDQSAILVFLRHFACIECRALAAQVWAKREEYQSTGGIIRFIGSGRPQFIEAFREDLNLEDAPIYTDPSLEVFKAAGFKRGFLAAAGPQALANGFKLKNQGYKSGRYQKGMGDLWQLGGLLVINNSGRVTYQFVSEVLGDFSPERDLQFIDP